jgi:tau tubulin kinase
VVPFITCGRHGEFNYLVMDLLGENISELRRRQASGRFSIVTTCLLALQMLASIKAVHEMGYLHRDVTFSICPFSSPHSFFLQIKPSNFAMGLGTRKMRVFMIDFGLSRRYVLPSGKVRPPRDQSGFRGTARYASINAHLAKDLARRDDLWSLLYMLIEFANGILPWRRIKAREEYFVLFFSNFF